MVVSVSDFRTLIDSNPAEREVQRFLQTNRHLLIDFAPSRSAKIVRQFPLGQDFLADFAFVHTDSGGNYLRFLELESPKHRLFNLDDSFSRGFNVAVQQIHDWLGWCRGHQDYLIEMIRPLLGFLKSEKIYFSGVLVIGRRGELLNNRRRQERFESRQSQGSFRIRTYDGFAEHLEADSPLIKRGNWCPPLYAYQKRGFVEIASSSHTV